MSRYVSYMSFGLSTELRLEASRPLNLAQQTTTLLTSNKEMEDIMKVKSLEDLVILTKDSGKIVETEAKNKRIGFVSMLLGTFGVSLLGNLLSEKWARATCQEQGAIKAGDGVFRAGNGTVRLGQDLQCCVILWIILKYKDIIKMNPKLMVFIQEITY